MKLSEIIIRTPAPDFYLEVADKIDAILSTKAPDIDLSRPGGWKQARHFLKAYAPRIEHVACELDSTSYARMIAVLVDRQQKRRRTRLRANWDALRPWAIGLAALAGFWLYLEMASVLASLFGWPVEVGR